MNNKIFKTLQANMPKISATEKAALDSGDIWLEADLFKNEIDWHSYKNIDLQKLTEKEQSFIDNELEEFLSMVDSYEINNKEEIPFELMDFMKKNKFFSFIIPEEYGGLDFSAYANSVVVSKIASLNSSLAVTVMVPNSLGPAELLKKYGTKEEKEKWLPKLATGEEFPCFGLTSPFAGSDAGSIPDKGIIVKKEIDGELKTGISLTINKRYITLAPIATVIGLAFKIEDPDGLLGENKDLGITCALIPSETEGVSTKDYHKPMNMAFRNGTIKGKNVFIPIDYVIGGKENIGKGWEMLMACLADGRGVSLPALATAKSQMNTYQTFAYSEVREQFNTPISKFEGVEEKLSEMILKTYINEATRTLTLAGLDKKIKPAIVTAITKYHTTEFARDILNNSMDIMAGKSIIQGKNNPSWDSYTGMPIAITVEGANILTRNLIIYGQGAIRCHPFILKEMETFDNNDEDRFNELLKEHALFFSKKLAKTIIKYPSLALSSKRSMSGLKSYMDYYSSLFYLLSDVSLLTLGGKLKFKENVSARLGDILSYLYMGVAVVSYYEKNKSTENEIIAISSLRLLMKEINNSLEEFYSLFPNKLAIKPLQFVTTPLGRFDFNPYPSENRNVLKAYSNESLQSQMLNLVDLKNERTSVNTMHKAYLMKKELKEVLEKIKKGKITDLVNPFEIARDKNIINEEEFIKLKEYQDLMLKVINVDEFSD